MTPVWLNRLSMYNTIYIFLLKISSIVPNKKTMKYETSKSPKSTTQVLLFKTWYFGHTGWIRFQTYQSTTQNHHLTQNDIKFQWSVSISRFPRICLYKVPIVSVQHLILSILDYHHINFLGFSHFPIIIPVFHGKSFGV